MNGTNYTLPSLTAGTAVAERCGLRRIRRTPHTVHGNIEITLTVRTDEWEPTRIRNVSVCGFTKRPASARGADHNGRRATRGGRPTRD